VAPNENVTEIAFDSGFEDVSHFSRVFKARFGVFACGVSADSFRRLTAQSNG